MSERPRQAPLAVVLCPPWPRSGSSSLFMGQVRTYLAMGYDVAVLVVPHESVHRANQAGFWRLVAWDFQFDPRQPVFLNRSTRSLRRLASGSYWSWVARRRDSALAIAARYASGSTFDPEFAALVDECGVDLTHVNHCINMGAAHRIAARAAGRSATPPVILLETLDVQAERYRICEIANPFTGRCDPVTRLTRDELALSRAATALLHATAHDLEHFRRHLPTHRHVLLRPTTRNEPERIDPHAGRYTVDFLYIGDGHRANVRSIEWLLDRVVPRLDTSRIRIRIAGGIVEHIGAQDPRRFAAHRNVWIGWRETIDDLYAASRFVMVPMVVRTGTSIKLVEALAMGKGIVASPRAVAAFADVPGIDEAVTIAESAEEFAAAMTAMASRPTAVNEKGRALYLRHFSNARCVATLSEVVAGVRRGRGGGRISAPSGRPRA